MKHELSKAFVYKLASVYSVAKKSRTIPKYIGDGDGDGDERKNSGDDFVEIKEMESELLAAEERAQKWAQRLARELRHEKGKPKEEVTKKQEK